MNNDKKPNILMIPRDKKGCGFYRMLMPAHEMREQGVANVNISYALGGEEMKWADLIVMQRPSDWDSLDYIRYARSLGKKVIYEVDDYLPGVIPQNPGIKFWDLTAGKAGRSFECMKACDAVTTTTQRLGTELAMWNRRVFVLPNMLDKNMWDNIEFGEDFEKKKKDDIIRIGWEGAAGHRQDLELVRDVVYKIVEDYDNVHFVLFGFTPIDVFHNMWNMEQKCPDCGFNGPLEFYQGCDVLEYPAKMSQLAFDIGIAPAVKISFNECKSDLRFREYSKMGIPTIASDIAAYDTIIHGKTGYKANTAKEWDKYLRLLIENEAKRKEVGKSAKEWAEEQTIQNNIWRWTDVYQKVLSSER